MEYPRLVYRSATDYRVVRNLDQHTELVGNGWFDSVQEALDPPVVKRATKPKPKASRTHELD